MSQNPADPGPTSIRILHLSDFHMGKDGLGQKNQFKHLLKEIEANTNQDRSPRLILLTGDIANKGQAEEYEAFNEHFLGPLKKLVPDASYFMVPGNHDVDREEADLAHGYDLDTKKPKFFDPDKNGFKARKVLHPRFEAYVREMGAFLETKWVTSEKGTHTEVLPIPGINLGVVLLNTAWFAGTKEDDGRLGLGKRMVEPALDEVRKKGAELILVLGHHPLRCLRSDHEENLESVFAQKNVVYLSGHIHKGKAREEVGGDFLTIGAGAAFQTRDDPVWVNGFQWYEVCPNQCRIFVEPRVWNDTDNEWKPAAPFKNKYHLEGSNRWAFPIILNSAAGLEEPAALKVLILSTDEDLKEYREAALNHLQSLLGLDVQAGSPHNHPDPAGFDLIILIQAWWWADGKLAKVYQALPDEKKRCLLVDAEADWPSAKHMERSFFAAIETFHGQVQATATFKEPGTIANHVAQLVETFSQERAEKQDGITPIGLTPAHRAYLELRLPTWKAGRTGAGKGFTGPDEIYEERFYVGLDGVSSRWHWDEQGDTLVERNANKETMGEHLGSGETRRPLAWWASRPECPFLVLSGSPGAGKTVFLTRFAAAVAGLHLGQGGLLEPHLQPLGLKGEGRLPLPVILEATALAKRNPKTYADLVDAVNEELSCVTGLAEPAGHEDTASGLCNGAYLVLIDALDEVAGEADRNQVLRWLKGLVPALKARVILTTRSARYTGEMAFGPEFEVVDLTDLNAEQIQTLCARFCTLKGESPAFLARLTGALNEVGRKHQADETHLVANPLLLATACSLFYRLGQLPNDRAALCYQIVAYLCQSKDSSLPNHPQQNWALFPQQKRDFLERIALVMQENNAQVWPLFRVYPVISAAMSEEQQQERDRVIQYVRWLVEHTGLLYMQAGEQGENVRFHHRLFREYLAASRLTKTNGPIETVLQRMWEKGWLTDPAWLDVVLLMPGAMNNPDKATQMAEFLKNLAQAQESQRGDLSALLAAVLVESQNLYANSPFKGKAFVQEALAAYELEGQHWEKRSRILLLKSFGWLGDPRLDVNREDYWVRFEPGTFTMGSDKDSDEPKHEETLVEDFCLGRYCVTNMEYGQFMKAGGYEDRENWSENGWLWLNLKGVALEKWLTEVEKEYKKYFGRFDPTWVRPSKTPLWFDDARFNQPNAPVVGINWFEAEAYCLWLNRKWEKKKPSWWHQHHRIMLPTEVEWEFAARGFSQRKYPWQGDKLDHEHANFDDKIGGLTPVGCYPLGVTPEGLHDMAGNVWEWCRDVYKENAQETRVRNEHNPINLEGDSAVRVLRGGAWRNEADCLRASFRSGFHVWYRNDGIGFRCCLVARSPEY